jgi:hypothetical protein
VRFISTNPVRVQVWPYVYDMAGKLLHDAGSYRLVGCGGFCNTTLAQWYAAGGYNSIMGSGPNATAFQIARRFTFGNEDPAGAGAYPDQYYYFGAIAAGMQKIGAYIP